MRNFFFAGIVLSFFPSLLSTAPAYYYASNSCGKCTGYFAWLKTLEEKDPRILFYKVDPYSASGRESYQLKWNSLKNPVGTDYFKFPALFIGDTLLTGNIRDDSLIFYYFYYRNQEENPVMVPNESKLHLLSTALLGLADGINPCAFTALVFLLSFLTVKGRKKKNVVFSGICYVAGIFFFYFFFGWASSVFLAKNFSFFPWTAFFVKILIIGFCLVTAFVQLLDAFKPAGRLSSLSRKSVERIHNILRINKNALFFIFFLVGIAVSFSELLCTGQIYIPTIVMISQVTFKTTALLLIYNVMFVLPLLAIIILYSFTSDLSPVQRFVQRNFRIFKIIIAAVILTLGSVVLLQILV